MGWGSSAGRVLSSLKSYRNELSSLAGSDGNEVEE